MTNNPSAFPKPMFDSAGRESVGSEDGMTLRDYFAAKALSGLIASPDPFPLEEAALAGEDYKHYMAAVAYEYADAMMKARGNE